MMMMMIHVTAASNYVIPFIFFTTKHAHKPVNRSTNNQLEITQHIKAFGMINKKKTLENKPFLANIISEEVIWGKQGTVRYPESIRHLTIIKTLLEV